MNLEMLYQALNNNFTDSQTEIQRGSFAHGWAMNRVRALRAQMNRLSPNSEEEQGLSLLPTTATAHPAEAEHQGGCKGQMVLSSPQKSAVFPGVFPICFSTCALAEVL